MASLEPFASALSHQQKSMAPFLSLHLLPLSTRCQDGLRWVKGWAGGISADLKWTPTNHLVIQTQFDVLWNWSLRTLLVSLDDLKGFCCLCHPKPSTLSAKGQGMEQEELDPTACAAGSSWGRHTLDKPCYRFCDALKSKTQELPQL